MIDKAVFTEGSVLQVGLEVPEHPHHYVQSPDACFTKKVVWPLHWISHGRKRTDFSAPFTRLVTFPFKERTSA